MHRAGEDVRDRGGCYPKRWGCYQMYEIYYDALNLYYDVIQCMTIGMYYACIMYVLRIRGEIYYNVL